MRPADFSDLGVDFLFLDAEFTSLVNPELISVGLVGVHDEFYAERTDFPKHRCSPFVRAQVLPKLGYAWQAQTTAAELPERVGKWLAGLPEAALVLAYDYAADLTLLMRYLPEPWRESLLPIDVRRNIDDDLLSAYFDRPGVLRHHALHDARALRHSCAPSLEQLQQQVSAVSKDLTSASDGGRKAFFRTRWPELNGAHPIQAVNKGMWAAVRELARRYRGP